jgi:hypothetical protein
MPEYDPHDPNSKTGYCRPGRDAADVLHYFEAIEGTIFAQREMALLIQDPKQFFDGHGTRDHHFVHIRDGKAAITICYRVIKMAAAEGQDKPDLCCSVGFSLSSPKGGCWNKRMMQNIAHSRLEDCPVTLIFKGMQFATQEEETTGLRATHIVAAIRVLILENPKWEFYDDMPLRPSRFSQRWSVDLIGPNSSLVTAVVDARPKVIKKEFLDLAQHIVGLGDEIPGAFLCDPYIDTWCTRIPRWARDVMAG